MIKHIRKADKNEGGMNMINLDFLARHSEKIARSQKAITAFWNIEEQNYIPTTVYIPSYYNIATGAMCSAGKYYTEKHTNLMAQIESIAAHLQMIDDDYLPHIDTFLGTPVIASAFGGNIQFFEDKDPWIEGPIIHHPRDIDRLKKPNPAKVGLTSRILEWIDYWKVQTRGLLPLSVTDIQGPLSVAIDLMGASSFYLALYDDPRRIKTLLEIIAETLIDFLKQLYPLIEEEDGLHEWTGLFFPKGCGRCRLSEDNLISLSPEMYMEFIHPYNELIFGEIDGGILHWCGDGSNNFKNALSTKGLKGIHNSSMGDMDLIISQIEQIQRMNADTGGRMVYFSSMMLPNNIDKAQELVQKQKGMRGVLNFIFYTLDGYGVSFGQSEQRGYRKLNADPMKILKVFLNRKN
jgi:hypothetical protein